MTDFSNVEVEHAREVLAEVKEESDIHLPAFATSTVSGLTGVALITQAEEDLAQQSGYALAGFSIGMSLAEMAAMAHHQMINDRNGDRAFKFHHDAAGLVGVALGGWMIMDEDMPDEMGWLILGMGVGAIAHHLLTELSFDFIEPEHDEIEKQAEETAEKLEEQDVIV